MILNAKHGLFLMFQALDSLVIQIDSVDRNIRRQRGGVNGKSVILRRDLDFSCFEVLHRLIAAAMAKLEFERLAPQGLPQNLVTEANSENRHPMGHQF